MRQPFLILISFLMSTNIFSQSYNEYLETVRLKKSAFKKLYHTSQNKDSILTLAGIFFEESITNQQYNYWKGTTWDFNGYTNIPQKGEIACGYYVSTNLKHLGVKINRYRMAQQSSKSEVKTIDPSPEIFYGNDTQFITYAKKNLADGLYILGMSNHVGMLQKKGDNIHLLHSNPINYSGVIKEHVNSCEVLSWSTVFVIGEISNNKNFIKKWLNETPVSVVMD